MTSLFADLETLVSTAVDEVYGEPSLITRQKKNQYFAGSADSSRDEIVVVGIVDRNPVTARVQDQGSYDGLQPTVGGDKFHVSYDISLFPEPAAYPAQNDLIDFYENPEIPLLRVSKQPEEDGIGRIICICEKAE